MEPFYTEGEWKDFLQGFDPKDFEWEYIDYDVGSAVPEELQPSTQTVDGIIKIMHMSKRAYLEFDWSVSGLPNTRVVTLGNAHELETDFSDKEVEWNDGGRDEYLYTPSHRAISERSLILDEDGKPFSGQMRDPEYQTGDRIREILQNKRI